jgi:hypothetical protein
VVLLLDDLSIAGLGEEAVVAGCLLGGGLLICARQFWLQRPLDIEWCARTTGYFGWLDG